MDTKQLSDLIDEVNTLKERIRGLDSEIKFLTAISYFDIKKVIDFCKVNNFSEIQLVVNSKKRKISSKSKTGTTARMNPMVDSSSGKNKSLNHKDYGDYYLID